MHTPPEARGRLWLPASVAVLLAGAFLIQARLAAGTGITFDETTYLSLSQDIFRHGSFDGCTSGGVAPLPLYLFYWLPACHDAADRGGSWEGHVGDPALVDQARWLAALVVGVPLVLLVFAWLYRRGGLLPATIGAGFVAFSPSVVAHAALATTDACFTLTTLLTLAALASYHNHPARPRLLVLALSFSLAILSKYSALFLLPVIAGVFLARTWSDSRDRGRWWSRLLRVAGVVALRLGVVGGVVFLVGWAALPGKWTTLVPPPVADVPAAIEFLTTRPFPAFLVSMARQVIQTAGGAKTYLCGEVSWTGFRTYFFVVGAVKSTPAELGLMLLAAGALLYRLRSRSRTRAADAAPWLWLAAGATLFALVSGSKKQLGVRYVLPLYPLLFLYTADLLRVVDGWRRVVLSAVLCGLLTGQVISAMQTQPEYLTYFNGFAGGPASGHRYLLDSNLDWGQDLPRLKEYMDRTSRRRVVLAYFGSAVPEAYGIEAVAWTEWPKEGADSDRFALSLNLLGESVAMRTEWLPFADLKPAERVGRSLLLYDLNDPAVQRALREAQRYYREQ